MALFLLLIISVFGLGLIVFRQTYLRNRIRQRLQFGISSAAEVSDANLSAGDYGLAGSARFFYYLSEFLSTKQGYVMLFGLGALLAAGTSLILNKTIQNIFVTAGLGGALLFLLAVFMLRSRRVKRLNLIKYELPNALEMTAAIMESGLGFEAALGHVIREADTKHPLYFDLAIMSEAMQRGRRRNEALRLWANRTKEASVADVAAGMIQADQTGASLGSVLKHHANTLMKENEAFLMRRAERLPVRMLAPMVLMILPSVLVVAAGPSVLRIFQIFKALMEKA
jgi:tight adherence protein C